VEAVPQDGRRSSLAPVKPGEVVEYKIENPRHGESVQGQGTGICPRDHEAWMCRTGTGRGWTNVGYIPYPRLQAARP